MTQRKKPAPEIEAALKASEKIAAALKAQVAPAPPKPLVILMEVELELGDHSLESALLDVKEMIEHIDGVGYVRYALIVQPTGELVYRDKRPRPLPPGQD